MGQCDCCTRITIQLQNVSEVRQPQQQIEAGQTNHHLTQHLFGLKAPFFSNSRFNMSSETDSAMYSEGHQFLTRVPPKFNRVLIPLPV